MTQDLKKYIILLFLALKFQYANTQDISAYFNLKDSAEIALIKGDYKLSNQRYYELISNNKFVFASDCYNAFQVSLLANDSINGVYFISKCFEQGISLKTIEQSPLISDSISLSYFNHVFKNYDSLRNIYLQKINWKLRDRIIKIYEKEQFYNEKFDQSNFFNFIPNRIVYKKVNKIAIDSLLGIIEEIGFFPGEKEIGIIQPSMYKFDSLTEKYYDPIKGRPYLNTHEYLMFAHYYQFGGRKDIDSLLLKSLYCFQLKPRDFAFVSDFKKMKKKNEYYSLKRKALKSYNKLEEPIKREVFIQNINKNRSKIGLYPLEIEKLYKKRIQDQREQYLLNNFNLIFIE